MPNIQTKDIKNILSKLAIGVEKNNLNPAASYIEIKTIDNKTISINVSNTDYFLHATVLCTVVENEEHLFATITGDTFINIIAKIDGANIDLTMENNALIMTTKNNRYTFPLIKKDGKTVELNNISFNENEYTSSDLITAQSKYLDSIAESNVQGLVNATFSKEIQQFIYVDNEGSLTFTDNIYINNFDPAIEKQFKILLNAPQARLLKIFSSSKTVDMTVFTPNEDTNNMYIKIVSSSPAIELTMRVQSPAKTETFPAAKIRNLSVGNENKHAIINKSKLDKALSRLMVFDKKFDSTVLDYSKLVFNGSNVELISIKNHNFERVEYNSANDSDEKYEAIIRFADLVNQLKAVMTDIVDISYGNGKAIVINSDIKQIIPEIKPRGVA